MSTTKVLNELECVTSAGILADSSQIRYKDSTTIRNTLDNIISESSGNTITVKYAKYASTDTSKGTIEERLTNLGFKQGSITLPNGTATVNSVKRQGNYCILSLKVDYSKTTSSTSTPNGITRSSGSETQSTWNFTIPEGLRPKSSINLTLSGYTAGPGYGDYVGNWSVLDCSITTSGTMSLTLNNGYYTTYLQTLEIYVGYEATPITNKG